MADGDFQPSSNERFRGDRGPRQGGGARDGGGREAGGFRIRLSDNEMRAARAVQEAFGLRSTVAALGLSIRTVAQLLEEGKLDEAVAQHRASGGGRPGGERRGPRPERGERPASSRPNPFARPAKPVTAAPEAVADAEAPAEAAPEIDATDVDVADAPATEAAAEA
ncbi:MAG: hypothetical protein RLZZ255_1025 [Cyanobacteriota bacterium]|jgi:hypothetical protein